jgi:hypothetical protein
MIIQFNERSDKMKAKTIYTFLIAGMYLAACKATENITPISVTATNTPIPTATFTPAPTVTSSPIPPPGKIMIVMDHELIVYPADPLHGTTFKNFIIPREKFDAAFPAVGEKGSPLVSP